MDEKDIVLPENSVPVVEDTTHLVLEATEPVVINADITVSKGQTFDNLYCSTCRVRLSDSQLMKTPIDYEINADGTTSTIPERYSLFCGTCQQFLGIHDPKAQKELSEMTRIRQENEKTQK